MLSGVASLPFSLPGNIGVCNHQSTSGSRGAIIYLQTTATLHDKDNETMANCLAWLVRRYGISAIAADAITTLRFDDVDVSQQISVDGLWCRSLLGPYRGPRVHLSQVFGDAATNPLNRYLFRGEYTGHIFGVDEPDSYSRQMAVYRKHFSYRSEYVRAFEALLCQLRQAASAHLSKETVGVMADDKLGPWSLSSIKGLAKVAQSTGIDLERFPIVKVVHDIDTEQLTLITILPKAREEVANILNANVVNLPDDLRRQLLEVCDALPDNLGAVDSWQHASRVFRAIRNACLQYELEIEAYPNAHTLLYDWEHMWGLLDLDGMDQLDDEQRMLTRAVEAETHDQPGYTFLDDCANMWSAHRLMSLKATYKDYKRSIASRVSVDSVRGVVDRYGLSLQVDFEGLRHAIDSAKTYYHCAIQRAKHIARQVNIWCRDERNSTSVLLLTTTGFLAQPVISELELGHIALYSVSPRIDEEGDHDRRTEEFYEFLARAG